MALCVFELSIALSFVVAAGVMTFSFLSIGAVLYWMFLKKSIALLIGVIVFKWPLLIYVVLLFMKYVEPPLSGLCRGFDDLVASRSDLACHREQRIGRKSGSTF